MRRFKHLVLAFMFISCHVAAENVHIALIKDGPAQSEFISEQQVKQEITDLLGNEFSVTFANAGQSTADWTIQGIQQIINNNYRDPAVDVVIAVGAISSNELSKRSSFPKPSIAAIIIDQASQNLPLVDNKSGVDNFTYVADIKPAGHEILFFRQFVNATDLTVMIEPILLESWPELIQLLKKAEKKFDVRFNVLPVTGEPDDLLTQIPSTTQAVVVGVLSQYGSEQSRQLAAGLIKRKLPSYAFIGEKGVENGFLVTQNQMNQASSQIARRIAIDVQRILLGSNARNLPVSMHFNNRVVYNEATGLAIGFAPKWRDIRNAKIINPEKSQNREAYSISQAVSYAIKNNLDLNASSIDVDLAKKSERLAKGNLYPSLSLGMGYTQINQEKTITAINPEKRTDVQLQFSQLLYSESVWSEHDIAEFQVDSQQQLYQSKLLDTVQQTATAYLNLLRTEAAEGIRSLNLEVTRKNLELAKNRLQIGSTGQSDVLRWRSQLATDQRDLFASTALRRNAELELARIMNLPAGLLVDTQQADTGSLLDILISERFSQFVDNKINWLVFQEYYRQEAVTNSPELRSLSALLSAAERAISANSKGYYIPDIRFNIDAGHNLDQSGLGAIDNPQRDSWTLGVQASLPLDIGGQRKTRSSQERLEKRRLSIQRLALVRQIDTSTGQALFNMGSSHPGIELSKTSADLANQSLLLVGDAYANGTLSITDLLDAQRNALSAKLQAADAEFLFLQDYILLMRAAGEYTPLLDKQYSNAWYDRINTFFRHKGIALGKH